MRRLPAVIVLIALLGPCASRGAHASPALPLLTIHLSDLRPGYILAGVLHRTRSNIHPRGSVSGPLLLSHGWIEGYDALYKRREAPKIEVGNNADRFRSDQGAHWWYGVSLLRVPSGYHRIPMPRVGDESTEVQSRAFVGIIFRRHQDVMDVYVSLQAPAPQAAVLALARLVDRRLQLAQPVVAPQRRSAPRSPALLVRAWVYPNPLPYGSYPTLSARAVPGAICTARVLDSAGRYPRVLPQSVRTADSNGLVNWFWHAETRNSHGTAAVSCAFRGQTRTTTAQFSVSG